MTAPSAHRPAYGRELRQLFNLDPTATFLNHGSFGLTPLAVLAAQQLLRGEMEYQPVQFLTRATLQPRLRAAAARLAEFLHADGNDLAFVDNATTGVNAVLRSLVLKAGDEVLITNHTYGAVRNAVRFVCARAEAHLVEVRLPFPVRGPDEIVAAVTAALTELWRTEAGAPPDMLGSMAAVRLPGGLRATAAAAADLHDRLWRDHRIEVPVIPLADALWVRISAQIYNDATDYARLAAAGSAA